MLLDLQDCWVFHFHQKYLLRRTLKLTVLYRYCYPLVGYEENDDFSQSAVANYLLKLVPFRYKWRSRISLGNRI